MFTFLWLQGAGSYKPDGGDGGGDSQTPVNAYFPQKQFITFDQINATAVIGGSSTPFTLSKASSEVGLLCSH